MPVGQYDDVKIGLRMLERTAKKTSAYVLRVDQITWCSENIEVPSPDCFFVNSSVEHDVPWSLNTLLREIHARGSFTGQANVSTRRKGTWSSFIQSSQSCKRCVLKISLPIGWVYTSYRYHFSFHSLRPPASSPPDLINHQASHIPLVIRYKWQCGNERTSFADLCNNLSKMKYLRSSMSKVTEHYYFDLFSVGVSVFITRRRNDRHHWCHQSIINYYYHLRSNILIKTYLGFSVVISTAQWSTPIFVSPLDSLAQLV